MDSSDSPNDYPFWSGDFLSNGSSQANDNEDPYYPFVALPSDATPNGADPFHPPAGAPTDGIFPTPTDDYPLPPWPLPPMSVSPAPLLLEDVVDLLALVPAEPTTAQQPTIPISDSGEPTQTIAPGAWSIPPPPPDYLENGPFAGSPVSSSLPRDMHSSGNSLYTDHHRPHPSTFAGQAQGPSSSTVHPTSSLMSHRTFQIEYQDMRPDPQETIPAEPPFPPQHVLRFGPNGHTPGIPLAIQPTSIPLPSSPSDEPSSPSSPRSSVSPATSTASLPYPPSPSDLRGTTLRWKIDQREDQGWRCECAIQPKKKKRHLESCPNNPNKPTDKCPYCSRIFRGGSRKSARSKHVSKFHKKHGSDRDESKGKR